MMPRDFVEAWMGPQVVDLALAYPFPAPVDGQLLRGIHAATVAGVDYFEAWLRALPVEVFAAVIRVITGVERKAMGPRDVRDVLPHFGALRPA